MAEESLYLDVLESVFLVTGDDRLIEMTDRLWAPFKGEATPTGETIQVEIRAEDGQFLLTVAEAAPSPYPDPWGLMLGMRNAVVEQALARNAGIVVLHAAVVVRENEAMLLAGPAWSGKTTLALELIKHGWNYFSDDVAPLDMETGQVGAFPKPLGIKAMAWGEVADLWEPVPRWLSLPNGAFVVPASRLPRAKEKWATPRFVVFLDFRDGERETQLHPIGQAEALARCTGLARPTNPESVQSVRAAIKACKAALLSYRSPASAAETIGAFVAASSPSRSRRH